MVHLVHVVHVFLLIILIMPTFQHLESGLHIAAWHGFPRIVEILCQAGADVDIKNEVSHFNRSVFQLVQISASA